MVMELFSQRFPFEVYVDCPKIICTCMHERIALTT
jgi:hypothetical protein